MARKVTLQLKFILKLTHPLKSSIALVRSLCRSWATCLYFTTPFIFQ